MPGPGGGSHGGGGHHGGSSHSGGHRSGGYHGGSFHGGMHHRPRGGMYYRPYGRRYYGGGCLSSFFGILLLPIFFVIFIFMMISSFVGNSFFDLSQGGTIKYDENKFQDYANTQYANEFGTSSAYEDNILLTILVDTDSYDEYYYIAWVGDHIKTDIVNMFGNNDTVLGEVLLSSINTNSYKYSLDSNIADAIEIIRKQIVDLKLDSSFNCNEIHDRVKPELYVDCGEECNIVKSHLTNKSSLELTTETVNTALEEFTNSTGIPIVVLVDEIDNVFSKSLSGQTIFSIIILIVLVISIIYFITRKRNKKTSTKDYYDAKYEER